MSDHILRDLSNTEFFEIAQTSYDNFIQEASRSSGRTVAEVKAEVGEAARRRSEGDRWFIIERDGQRVGFIWFQLVAQTNSAFVWDLFIEPSYRSKGIARSVLQRCLDEFLSEISVVRLCVFEHNEIARKLYKSFGFEVEKFDQKRKQYTLRLARPI